MKPYHVAIIPDGNRRWARKKGMEKKKGYEIGIRHIGDVLKWCRKSGVRMLSMWGFSTENFNRPKDELDALFGLFASNLTRILQEGDDSYRKYKVRVRFIGRKDYFPKDVRQKLWEVERKTEKNNRYFLNIFLGYGGRQEILDAANAAIKAGRRLNEEGFEKLLYTASIPAPDIIIRTSGEQRLSGFLPWQAAYSELYFCKKLWPDFSRRDFEAALKEYARRKRRYGK
ncbi:di-trans,poly-cis-decaprenylcistransferase [Candidatus Micrarchaeota archaeon]|nr:di-trans,poly-cis-decaprenylcistransferase [Candidatus Micrarchaeota archaeon]